MATLSGAQGGQGGFVLPAINGQAVNAVVVPPGGTPQAPVAGQANITVSTSTLPTTMTPSPGYVGVINMTSDQQTVFVAGNFIFQVPDQQTAPPPSPTVAGSNALPFASDPTVVVGSGNMTVIGGAVPTNIMGGSGADSLIGGSGPTTITGGTGPSTIIGGSGPSTLTGGSASSLIYGGTGAETVSGGTGSNVIYGGGVHDAILGGSADDRASTVDMIFGGSGPNTIVGGTGPTTIVGGSGPNTIVAHDMFAPAGSDLILDQGTSINDTVFGFSQALGDAVSFAGETPETVAAVVGSAQVANGNTTITLPDNSTITLVGITHLDSSFFR
jgi:Ca2+-binding RTX toxin-like protein